MQGEKSQQLSRNTINTNTTTTINQHNRKMDKKIYGDQRNINGKTFNLSTTQKMKIKTRRYHFTGTKSGKINWKGKGRRDQDRKTVRSLRQAAARSLKSARAVPASWASHTGLGWQGFPTWRRRQTILWECWRRVSQLWEPGDCIVDFRVPAYPMLATRGQ